jgi:PAS domain S-box-containing protein
MDNVAVQHTAEVFLASGRISGIRIVADVGGTNDTLVDKPSHYTSILPVKHLALVKDNHNLGSVELWFSDKEIRAAQQQTVLITIITIVTLLAVNAISIYFILQFLLVKPLSLLKQKIETLATGSFDGSLPSVPQQDLNPIMIAMNNMANELSKKTNLLVEERQKYKQIFNAPSDAIMLHDASTGRILDANLAMLKMFGYSDSATKKLNISDLSLGESPYSQKEAIAFVEKAAKEGEQLFEWRSKRKNGDIFWSEVALRSSQVKGERRVLAVVRDISERKQAEQALLNSEEKYRLLVENAQEAILVSQEGKVKFFNSKVLEISGYSAEEVQDMKIEDFIYPDDRSAFISVLQKRLAGEDIPPLYSFRVIDKTGKIKWIEENSVLISWEGKPAVLSIASDITPRKESEQKIIDSVTRYQTLFESAGDSIFIIEKDVFVDCNQKTLELFNCSREDIIGQPPYVFSPTIQPDSQDSKEKAIEKINRAFAGKQQFFEWQHKKNDGTLFDAEVSLNVFEIGPEKFIQAIVRDVTQRKQAEQALRQKEQQQSLILRSLPMAFYVAQPFGTYGGTWVSEQIEDISGFTPEKFIANIHLWVDRLHPDDKEHTLSEFEKITEKGSISVEYRWQAADDSYFWINDEAVLIRDENGEAKEIVGTWLDISERKKLENELRQAQKMEAIGTLAGGIAHDFNNILTALFGYTELAMMRAKNDLKLTEDLDEVRQAGRRAKDLVKQILTFSRKTEQEKQPLQLSLVVKEALKLLRSSLPSTISFKQNIVSSSTVLADPTQIHQIVMNLSTNAYHAMKEKGGILGISLQDIDINSEDPVLGIDLMPGKYLQLEISDTGSGMDKDTCSKIFEPYFTTKEKGEGTGLGLAVVHGIVQSHNGHINVYSQLGEGTTFHIYLPRIPEKHSESAKKEKEIPTQGHYEQIMFVDDEEKIINMASEIFKEYGYKITTFINSSDALHDFENQPDKYDLVITDETMPGMIGTEMAKKMMTIRPDIPIILCTGYSATINRERVLEMGIKEYVQKPIVMSRLVNNVKKILDKAS